MTGTVCKKNYSLNKHMIFMKENEQSTLLSKKCLDSHTWKTRIKINGRTLRFPHKKCYLPHYITKQPMMKVRPTVVLQYTLSWDEERHMNIDPVNHGCGGQICDLAESVQYC